MWHKAQSVLCQLKEEPTLQSQMAHRACFYNVVQWSQLHSEKREVVRLLYCEASIKLPVGGTKRLPQKGQWCQTCWKSCKTTLVTAHTLGTKLSLQTLIHILFYIKIIPKKIYIYRQFLMIFNSLLLTHCYSTMQNSRLPHAFCTEMSLIPCVHCGIWYTACSTTAKLRVATQPIFSTNQLDVFPCICIHTLYYSSIEIVDKHDQSWAGAVQKKFYASL